MKLTEELCGVSVDDPDVEVVDEQGDPGAGKGSADADVVQAAVVPQGDAAGLVDLVVPDAPVRSMWGPVAVALGRAV